MQRRLLQRGAYGGGLYVRDSVASMTLCVVRENDIHGWVQPYAGFNKESADAQGGGVYVTNTDQVFEGTNCVIAGNTAKATGKWNGVYGAGLNFTGRDLGSDLNLTNCVVARNLAVDGGWYAGGGPVHAGVMVSYPSPALGNYQGGNGVIQNTIATENLGCHINWGTPTICSALDQPSLDHPSWVTSLVNYSIGQSSVLTGVGNIDLEPEFVGTGTTLHDLAIASSSAAVDAGNPAPAFDDVAFPPSLGGARNDMGINGGPLAGGWALLPSGP